MARNQYSFEKRRREIEKKKKMEEKKERKLGKTDSSPEGNPDSPVVEGGAETDKEGQV